MVWSESEVVNLGSVCAGQIVLVWVGDKDWKEKARRRRRKRSWRKSKWKS